MADTLHTLRRLMMAQPPVTDRLDLNSVLQEIHPILQNEAKRRGHVLEWMPCEHQGPVAVTANKTLLERILFNLVTNAFEALESHAHQEPGPPGKVTLRTAVCKDALLSYGLIEVEDSGPGIHPDILNAGVQVYKTKKEQGLGLGLALARIIVETWRGRLELQSPVARSGSRGTLVTLRIPLSSDRA